MNTGIKYLLPVLACTLFVSCSGDSNKPVDQQGQKGDPCTSDERCSGDLVCAHDGTCQEPRSNEDEWGDADEGDACTTTDDCGYGLVCGPDNTCIESGVSDRCDGCSSNEDCRFGLICTSAYVCDECGLERNCFGGPGPGCDGGPGTPCAGQEDCNETLVCAGDGTCQDPDTAEEGVAGPGEACETTEDCRRGLVCFSLGLEESVCQAPEVWSGVDCQQSYDDESDTDVPFKVFFEIPRSTDVTEFYRLPFPNNIRFRGGHIDMSGHPAPNTPLASGVIEAYLDAIENEATGFSTQAAVFFRFSKRVDFDTIDLTGEDANFLLVNIDPASAGYGNGGAISMFATTSAGKYICGNWMAMKPSDGWPLRHATTYAVIITDGIHSSLGSALVRDDDFDTMLDTDEPGDSTEAEAWAEYQPLRDYLADGSIEPPDADSVMAAAVFTTMDPDALMERFRDKVRDCSGSDCTELPDPDPVGMSLDGEEMNYYVVTGTVSVPVFQEGSPPYLTEGGGVRFNSSDDPIIQRNEPVDFTLSVPVGTPPTDGWPVVIYAHGTGGSSGSFLDNGVVDALSELEVTIDSTPTTVKFAVLGIDAVQHGSRRGGSSMSPDLLYFNFMNPEAAKHNAVQGAADNFQLVRMIESLNTTPVTVTGITDPVQLDPNAITYFGHSQGSMTGPLFLAYSPAVPTVVLSGAGGNLIQSLLTKTQPFDIAGATKLVLGDANVGAMHPMLNLFQLYFDPVDTVNYARDLTYDPRQVGEIPGDPPTPIYAGPKNVFMSFGRDDHFSTEKTMMSFLRPLGVQQINDLGLDCNCYAECDTLDSDTGLHESLCLTGMGEATTPVRGNGIWGGRQITAVMKMYLPDGYDGHFVLFNDAEGADDYSRFLASSVADPDNIPTFFP